MKVISKIFIFFICFSSSFSTTLSAQKVTVSKEFNIRSDRAYDIIAPIAGNIMLYRDAGEERMVEVFDNDLKFLFERSIEVGTPRSTIYAMVPQDSIFSFIYGFRKDAYFYMGIQSYDGFGQAVDTTLLIDSLENFKIERFNHVLSEDHSKTLLFAFGKRDLFTVLVIDNINRNILWTKDYTLLDYNLPDDFRFITVSNDGQINMLLEKNNNRWDRRDHYLAVIGLYNQDEYYENRLYFDNKYTIDLEFAYDDLNQSIAIAGLVSDENEYDATGYFTFVRKVNQLKGQEEINTKPFTSEFLEDLYGEKLSKKKRLNDFITREIILRKDGGFLLFTEMHKEYYRRSAFTGPGRFRGGGPGGTWVDIYNEDIIVFSANPDGSEHWKQILYKKQFSQDDDGAYSSFFLFFTPSRLRIIYNDEIKKNNTVSEYVMDPLGNFERNSLLSTEYQNLKLRFRDGLQIGPNTLIVPSERNFKISLVKIEF